jgi:alpha-1,6-mannosyltransferase
MRRPSSPRALRWWGLAASTLVALTGYLAGSPDKHDAPWIAGVVLWAVAAGALVWLWLGLRGPALDRRWLLVTGALWALPFLLAPPLGSHDIYAYACQGQLFNAGYDLYRVGPDALPCTWLDHVPPLWHSTPTPYGPLWIAIEGLAAKLAGHSLIIAVTALRLFAILATLLGVAGGVRLAERCGAGPGRFVHLAAISPLIMIHVISGAHNDELLAALVLAALAVAATDPDRLGLRTTLTGMGFGLAAGVKVTALVAAPFAVLLLTRGRARATALAGSGLVAVIAVTYLVLAELTGHGLGFLHALSSTSDLVQWLSLPTGVGMAIGYALRVIGLDSDTFGAAVAVTRAIGLVVLALILVLLWWRALRRVRSAPEPSSATASVLTAAGLALLATAALGPVFYAWYAIGGLAVLAATPLAGRLRTVVTAAAGGLIFLTLPDSLGLATKTKVPGAFLDVALLVTLAVRGARGRARARLLGPTSE